MKTVIASREALVSQAADRLAALLEQKPEAVLAIAAGETMTPLFAELVRRCADGALSLARCRLFSVAEYLDAPEGLRCADQLRAELVARTDLQEESCRFLCAENLERYDDWIARAGGLDLALLGLGTNAHIGFNEPATPFASRSRRQKLTEATRRQKAARFGGEAQVPDYGLTMGIKTITQAREILLLAFGEEKAEAAFRMLYGRNDSAVPAAFLQIPSCVTAYLDPAAAAKL